MAVGMCNGLVMAIASSDARCMCVVLSSNLGGFAFSFVWMAAPQASKPPDKRLTKWQVQQLGLPDDSDARLYGHQGHVHIDLLPDGSQVVTHCLTLRSQALPESAGPSDLMFVDDNDGYGSVVDYGTIPPTAVTLEDFLTRQLYQTKAGIFWVAEMDEQKHITSKWCLTDRQRECEAHTVEVHSTDIHGDTKCYYVKWPRDGMKFFWGLNSLYTLLKLQLTQKKPSKWSYQLAESGQLASLQEKFGIGTTHIKGNSNLSIQEALTTTTSFLPD